MAHFKQGNFQLKTNQQIQLGDNQESSILYDGADLVLSPSGGAVKLYFDGTKEFETISGGVSATDYYGNGSNLTGVSVSAGPVQVINEIQAATGNTAATFVSGGAATLYYNEIKAFETTAEGAQVWDTNSAYPKLDFYRDDGTLDGQFGLAFTVSGHFSDSPLLDFEPCAAL